MIFAKHSFLLILTFLIVSFADIPQNYTIRADKTLIADIINIGYTPDQKYLIVLQNTKPGSFFVFDGLRINNPKEIQIDPDTKKLTVSPSAFAFSKDGSLMAIGSKEGGVYLFQFNNGVINQTCKCNYAYGNPDNDFWIHSLSFSKDNLIAVAAKNTLILLSVSDTRDQLTQDQLYTFQNIQLTSVSWSPLESNIVLVGGYGPNNGTFSVYNTDDKKPTLIKAQNTESISFFPDGKTVLKGTIGKDIDVYTYQTGKLPVLVNSIPGSAGTTQIWISRNGLYVAAEANGKVLGWKVNSDQKSHLKSIQQITGIAFVNNLNQAGSNVALSSDGNDILIIPVATFQKIVSHFQLCPAQTYFQFQASDCAQCSDNCLQCAQKAICINCPSNKFINGDKCTNCNQKLNGCQECDDQSTCTLCDQNSNWNKSPEGGKCICKNTFYNKDGVCALCFQDLRDCQFCKNNQTCDSCKNEGDFDTNPVQGKCFCKKTFYLNEKQKCLKCSDKIPNCDVCSMDGSTCQSCIDPNRQTNQDNTLCVCKPYRYEDPNSHLCQLCDIHQNCVRCDATNPSNCSQCDAKKHFKTQPQQGKCMCEQTYFQSEQVCLLCEDSIPDCKICNNQKKCTQCKGQNNFDPNPVQGACSCIKQWILKEKTCVLCSSQINGCLECSTVNICTLCNENNNFNKDADNNGKCHCKKQFWLNGATCQPCNTKITGCSECSEDGKTCNLCTDTNKHPKNDDNSSCTCNDFLYEQNNQCKQCDIYKACVKCDELTPHKCQICDKTQHWNSEPADGVCKCQPGYNQFNGKCILCQVPGCVQCESEATCKECSKDKKFNPQPNHDKCQCMNGTCFSLDHTYCQDCNLTLLGCTLCDNQNSCVQCDKQKHFIISTSTDKCNCMASYYLKNQVCQTCDSVITKCILCEIVTGSLDCYKCESGYGTSANRKQCIDCSLASVGCLNCTDAATCTQCDTNNKFQKNQTTGKCQCILKYYLNQNRVCDLCENVIAGCSACQNQGKCSKCRSDMNFEQTPQNGKCVCTHGYTLDGKLCIPCSVIDGCLQCSSTKTCQKCDQINHFQPNQQKTCSCAETYFQKDKQCVLCEQKIFNCKDCSPDGSTCQSCIDPQRRLNDDHTKCQCKDYLYENEQNKCVPCDKLQNCLSCQNIQPYNCTKCDKSKHWIQQPDQGKCSKCQTGYIIYQESYCILCQIKGCTECSTQNNCTTCSQQKKFNPKPMQGLCVCADDTHPNDDFSQCYYCNQKLVGCKNCDNLKQCLVCDQNAHFALNINTKLCQCQNSYFLNNTQCLTCDSLIHDCNSCEVTQTDKKCTSCNKGFLVSEDRKSCISCKTYIPGCNDCTDQQKCLECDQKDNFVQVDTKCQCRQGYFLKEENCVLISDLIPGCTKCNLDATKCLQCTLPHFNLNKGTGLCDCEDSYFLKQKLCALCITQIPGCTKCSPNKQGSADCGQCKVDQNFVLNNQTKKCDCTTDRYLDQDKCTLCSQKITGCLQCLTNGSECTHCDTDQKFQPSPQKQCQCQSNYFLNKTMCTLCSKQIPGCMTCIQNGSACNECDQGHHFVKHQDNICYCQQRYFLQIDRCQSCILGCLTCSNQTQCAKCSQGQHFVLNSSTHLCDCSSEYYLKNDICNLCETKMTGCISCIQEDECKACSDKKHFVLNNQTNFCQCHSAYFLNDQNECKLCSQRVTGCSKCDKQSCKQCSQTQNFIFNTTTKACDCSNGFYFHEKKCQLCKDVHPGCIQCKGDDGQQCDQCDTAQHFKLDSQKHLCVCSDNYFFSSKDKCSLCSDTLAYCMNCQIISQANDFTPVCSSCKDSFTLVEGACGCLGQDKQIKDGLCVDKQKSNEWIVFAIIGGVGVVIIGIVSFIVIKKCRKPSKLEQDSYDKLDEQTNNINRTVGQSSTILTSEKSKFNKSSVKSSQYEEQD